MPGWPSNARETLVMDSVPLTHTMSFLNMLSRLSTCNARSTPACRSAGRACARTTCRQACPHGHNNASTPQSHATRSRAYARGRPLARPWLVRACALSLPPSLPRARSLPPSLPLRPSLSVARSLTLPQGACLEAPVVARERALKFERPPIRQRVKVGQVARPDALLQPPDALALLVAPAALHPSAWRANSFC